MAAPDIAGVALGLGIYYISAGLIVIGQSFSRYDQSVDLPWCYLGGKLATFSEVREHIRVFRRLFVPCTKSYDDNLELARVDNLQPIHFTQVLFEDIIVMDTGTRGERVLTDEQLAEYRYSQTFPRSFGELTELSDDFRVVMLLDTMREYWGSISFSLETRRILKDELLDVTGERIGLSFFSAASSS